MSYKITYRQQAKFDELKAFHFEECPSIEWEKEAVEPFSKNELGPNEKVWVEKELNYNPSFIPRKIGLSKIVTTYLRFNKKRGSKVDCSLYRNWEQQYPLVKSMLEGDQESWREVVKTHATFHKRPQIAEAYSLHVHNANIIECDVYLHTLEKMIPSRIEKVTKRGNVRYHDMPKTKRYELYESYVYSCLNKITNDLFAVLPCHSIFINGVTGTYENHLPILSSLIERKRHQQKRCPKRTIERHRHMVTFKKRSGFYPLNRVYSPQVLFSKEL
ncbi:hypothetical protein [Virgibacillus sp. DJP39]|uniref:hypothetical protein n=1 Tax=Virgibacillus sp. DJP39 TaxID=3409790 RepID=UPI003BB6C4F9